MQKEPQQTTLSADDYVNMALFLAEFLPLIQINEIYLCLDAVGCKWMRWWYLGHSWWVDVDDKMTECK